MVISNGNGIFFALLFWCWLSLVLQDNGGVKYMALGRCELCLAVKNK